MKPVSPVLLSQRASETVFGKAQSQYIELPTVVEGARVISRWHLSFKERLRVLFSGDLYLTVLDLAEWGPLAPAKIEVEEPRV